VASLIHYLLVEYVLIASGSTTVLQQRIQFAGAIQQRKIILAACRT
jgi:hypothetical protein